MASPQGFRHPLSTLGIWHSRVNITGEYGIPTRDLGIPYKLWASGSPELTSLGNMASPKDLGIPYKHWASGTDTLTQRVVNLDVSSKHMVQAEVEGHMGIGGRCQ